ncbi:neuronal acetylcholine receptor subunit alpha-3 [Eurytemora carolleeae]|uniref:neuronal acetylcholine receptor subunit alpha-3 n=1 Tax=Eurytemora carolleeae TaxID=1294199 RepID=UPI000C76FE7F|nr:neuronal acetylcholine receptor subunit alpha-3 [Eurytemora carolleeae]|eukprot:XP_023333763.1 neuronal acetylcholine receptor subunit alpha-3-like [Eurytemora affinis]
MSLSVRSVNLGFSTGIFQTAGWMKLKWEDERYRWEPDKYENIESVNLPFSKDWSPDVLLYNGLEDKFMYNKVGILEHTGEITYIIALYTQSSCSPNFTDFPWGIQVCSLKFGSWINTQYRVEYRLPSNSSVGLNEFESGVGWKIVNTSSRLQSVQHS